MKALPNNINPIIANFSHLSDDVHIRPKQAALILGIGIATFWRLVSSYKLKTYKLTERTTTVKVGDLRAFMACKSDA
jgi:predicted DNA-binding protein (UPF0251 family)